MGGKERDIANVEDDLGELPKMMAIIKVKVKYGVSLGAFWIDYCMRWGRLSEGPEASQVLGVLKE